AERHKKQIIPLMWRKTDIPPAMEYQLAGIQYIDFAETVSEANFSQMAEVIKRLVGGASFVEAAGSSQAVKAAPVPAIEKEPAAASSGGRSGRTLRGKGSLSLSPIAIGGRVTSSVITTFGLGLDQQDEMGQELKWLFSAADHTLKIQNGEANADSPIPVPIPPNVQVLSGANDNKITHPAHAAGQSRQINDILKRIKKRLDALDDLLVRDAELGEAAVNDRMLQSEIKGNRVAIVEDMKVLAAGIEQAYEIRVEAPDLLLDYLEQA
ncbi:MAG: hypothetical protein R3264_10945, partial [Anaerolineae bacterium]|nr:hypothetical protein [Anaerolineae bacterium]